MKLIGIDRPDGRWIAHTDGVDIWPIAPLDVFWEEPAKWTRTVASLTARPPLGGRVSHVVPLPPSARIFCVGLNFRAHAVEGGFNVPDHPTIFGRWTRSLSVSGVPVSVPIDEAGLDWEVEVAAIVGKTVRDVDEPKSLDAVIAYATFNDITARRAQKLTAQWTLGKNVDNSGPLGPLVTVDEVGHPDSGWEMTTRVNGKLAQRGNTADMIFSPAELVARLSRTLTLHPGDVIATGTPEGVGYTRNPPWLLGDGDIVAVQVDPLGVVWTPITAP